MQINVDFYAYKIVLQFPLARAVLISGLWECWLITHLETVEGLRITEA
jgi:hypothetical protein